jgi:hypothetical protein
MILTFNMQLTKTLYCRAPVAGEAMGAGWGVSALRLLLQVMLGGEGAHGERGAENNTLLYTTTHQSVPPPQTRRVDGAASSEEGRQHDRRVSEAALKKQTQWSRCQWSVRERGGKEISESTQVQSLSSTSESL